MFKFRLILITCLFVTSCSKQVSVEQLIDQANEALINGDNATAIIHLKRALRRENGSIDAHFLLGKLYLENGDFLSAQKEIERALSLSTNNEGYITDYFRVLNETENESTVLDFYKKQEALTDSAKLHAAYSALKVNDMGLFEKISQQVNTKNLTTQEAKFHRLLLLASKQDSVAIQSEFSTHLKKDHIIVEGLELLGHLFSRDKKYALAVRAYKAAYHLRPKNNVLKILIAQNLIQGNNFSDAKPYIKELLTQFPNHGYSHQLAAQVAINDSDFQLAKLHATKAILSGLNSNINTVIAGLSSYQLGMYEQARSYLLSISRELPTSHPIQKVLAATSLKLGFTNEAVEQLSDISLITDNDFDLIASASINLIQNNQADKANELLSKIASPDDTNNANLLSKVGVLKLSAQDISGMDFLYKAIRIDGDSYSAKTMLISSFLSTNKNKEAKSQVIKWLTKTPEDTALLNMLAYIEIKNQNHKEAKIIFTQIITIEPTNIKANMFFGVTEFKQENFQTAIKSFNTIVQKHPNYLPALLGLYLSEKSSGDTTQSIKLITSQAKEDSRIKLLLAKIYITEHQYIDAVAVLNTFKSPSIIAQIEDLKSSAYIALYDEENALTAISNWRKVDPSSERALILKLSILELNKSHELALQEISSFKRNNPYSLKLDLLEINFQLLANQVSKAVELLDKLKEKNVNTTLLLPLEARSKYQLANYKVALPLLVTSYENDPSSIFASLIYTSLVKLNKINEAVTFLEKRVTDFSADTKSRLFLADTLSKIDKNKALEHFYILNEQLENNLMVLNNIAWLLHEQGKNKEALPYAQKALDIAPTNLQLQDTINQIKAAIQ
tara:strand:+ start:2348 stop:4882 length:2535 start_codon:yes stop_codon:yes gene_type:complete